MTKFTRIHLGKPGNFFMHDKSDMLFMDKCNDSYQTTCSLLLYVFGVETY